MLNGPSFDKEDSGWLEIMISAFLVTIGEFTNGKYREDRGRDYTLDANGSRLEGGTLGKNKL
ncbi:MAG: hypothetical protein BA873_13990 [Desulfobulbaceae bacterium C00003063]|nr:MAG: hypothetical protein BA873_13990 [Desulfobulbaceae bacterium C00003063]